MVKVKTKKTYHCKTCKIGYKNRKAAERCEAMRVEFRPSYAEVGQEIVSEFFCGNCGIGYTIGKITEIVGPVPADVDFEARLVQVHGRIGILHVYYLHIKAPCTLCKRDLPWIKAVPQVGPNKRF